MAQPAPPSTTPVNTSIAPPTKAESFNNLAVRANADITMQAANGAVEPATFTFTYDPSTNSYTMSSNYVAETGDQDGFSTFDQSTDPTERTGGHYLADHFGGGIGDYYRVTHTGHDSFVYTYTAFASWDAETHSTTDYKTTYDALVFGVPTAFEAIPQSGTASFALDLFGQELGADPSASYLTELPKLDGSGTATIDFAAGTFSMAGTMNAPASGANATTSFSGSGNLNGSANGFAGSFSFDDAGQFAGTQSGWFFGPNAEELGSVFMASAADGRVAAGAILGHR